MFEVDVHLPRSAFTPREVARAGDIWRAFQEIAVAGSTLAGWPPARYREERLNFIVRTMTVVHAREAVYGEAFRGRTWAAGIRRGMFFQRECRLDAPDGAVARTTQHWVLVSADVKPMRGPASLVDAFVEEDLDAEVVLPDGVETLAGTPTHAFELECWHTWMDPLAHVNHPVYVDWCDEGISRVLAARGVDPAQIVPVAERVQFRDGVVAGQTCRVETRLAGRAGDVAVFEHRVRSGDRECARATTHRRLLGASDLLRHFVE
jgi:acyl-CoA thioesterase FadM